MDGATSSSPTKRSRRSDSEGSLESSSDSSDSSIPEVGLDQHGRVFPGVKGAVNYGFRGILDAVRVTDELLRDCQTVFTASDTKDNEAYSSGDTFWIGANEEPECALERLALDVFKFHALGEIEYDPETSGAEWWTLVLDDDSNVAFHWDKDYYMENYGVNLFPNISTVTYLSDVGGPTCVLQKTSPPRPTEDFSGFAGSRMFVSLPKKRKHISFDGRFLHYASPDLLGLFTDQPLNGTRVTFLVNVWFNHHPKDAVRLSDAVRGSLGCNRNVPLWSCESSTRVDPVAYPCTLENCKSKIFKYDFGAGDEDDTTTHTVLMRLPEVRGSECCIFIEYSKDTLPLVQKKGL